MKKYILILLILSYSIIKAQEFEPTEAMTFTLYHPNTQASFVGTLANTMFDQTEFIRGWQWGAPPIETDAFNMNMVQHHTIYDDGTYDGTCTTNSTYTPTGNGLPKHKYICGATERFALNSRSLQFEANYDPSTTVTMHQGAGEPPAIFGFETIEGGDIGQKWFSPTVSTVTTLLTNSYPSWGIVRRETDRHVENDARYDGFASIATNNRELPVEEILSQHRQLYKIEETFRTFNVIS